MTTPEGLLPAAIVWVATPEDPVLPLLRRAFGGHLMLEMSNHHGEESPAFWVGVGRSAVLALGVLLGALDARERMADEAGAAGWGARAPLPRAELLGQSAEAAWRELESFSTLLMRGPGAPLPPTSERVGRGAALEARVAGAFTLAPHISGGLNTAMLGLLRSEAFAVNLALPSRGERDAWVAGFLAPLLRPRGGDRG